MARPKGVPNRVRAYRPLRQEREEESMASFEEVLYKAKEMAEAAGKKTADFVEVTRLKMNAAEIEKDIAVTFEGLGRLIYDGRKDEQDVSSMVDECILKVDELQARLDEVRNKIYEYQKVVRCQKCGTVNTDDSAYCKRCGARIGE